MARDYRRSVVGRWPTWPIRARVGAGVHARPAEPAPQGASYARLPGRGSRGLHENLTTNGQLWSPYSGDLPTLNAAPKLRLLTSTQENSCVPTNGCTWPLR